MMMKLLLNIFLASFVVGFGEKAEEQFEPFDPGLEKVKLSPDVFQRSKDAATNPSRETAIAFAKYLRDNEAIFNSADRERTARTAQYVVTRLPPESWPEMLKTFEGVRSSCLVPVAFAFLQYEKGGAKEKALTEAYLRNSPSAVVDYFLGSSHGLKRRYGSEYFFAIAGKIYPLLLEEVRVGHEGRKRKALSFLFVLLEKQRQEIPEKWIQKSIKQVEHYLPNMTDECREEAERFLQKARSRPQSPK